MVRKSEKTTQELVCSVEREIVEEDKTLQEHVIDSILNRIQSGDLKAGDKLMPERNMSVEFGVSRTTITKALHKLESNGWISRQQGRGTFVCDPGLNDKTGSKGRTIALLAAVPAHPSLFRCFTGLSKATNDANGQLRLLGSFEGLGSEREMLDRALKDGADGIIVYPGPGYSAPRIYSELIARHVPVVMIDRYFPDLASDRVTYADEIIGNILCGELFDSGCKRIAILPHHEFEVTSVRDRISGAKSAAAERDLPADSVAIWHDVYFDFFPARQMTGVRKKRLERLTERLQNDHVDGLFAINGDVANRVCRDIDLLRNGGIEIPPVQISAFGHQPVDPPLGSAIIMGFEKPEDLGLKAAELLFQRIDNIGPNHPLSVEIKLDHSDISIISDK